jgi:amidophosphoribosyltransferase
MEGVYEAIGGSREAIERMRSVHCDACFTGSYPLPGTEDAHGKHALESQLPLIRA